MPQPLHVSIDALKVASAGRYSWGLILGGAVLTVAAGSAATYVIASRMSWFTAAVTLALALGSILVVFTSLRRKNLLHTLAGDGAEVGTVTVDDAGVHLAGLPFIPWTSMVFVGILDDDERTVRLLRRPLLGWTGAIAIKAGSGKIGCEIGVRDGEALRAACANHAQRRRISVFNSWPDGTKRGTVGLILDAVLADADVSRALTALESHAHAAGVPFRGNSKIMDYFGWKGPMLDPKWD